MIRNATINIYESMSKNGKPYRFTYVNSKFTFVHIKYTKLLTCEKCISVVNKTPYYKYTGSFVLDEATGTINIS